MQDSEGVLERLNKSKRKRLIAFLGEHDKNGNSRIITAGSADMLPESPRKDRGTAVLILIGENFYNPLYTDYYTLLDTINADGSETFKHYYKRASLIAELIDGARSQEQPPTNSRNAGRKKREFTEQEQKHMEELHAAGIGIGRIAKELKTSNRKVIEYFQNQNR